MFRRFRLFPMKTLSFAAAGLLSCVAFPAIAAEAAAHGHLHVFQHENVLGTSLELKVLASSPGQADQAETAALGEIDRLAHILSSYESASEVSRWLRTSHQPVAVSAELYEVLALFDQWRERSDGSLDAAAANICQLWQAAARLDRMPEPAAIAAALTAVKQPHWSLDPAAHTATHLSDVPLVFNSFAKSYIASRACDTAMAAAHVDALLVNIGGDLVLRGDLTETVAIANPQADAENDPPLASIRVRNQAVATSGNYRRGVTIAGRWFSHIVDPRSGQPVSHVLSATVVAANAADAGALATACCVLQPEASLRLVASLPAAECLLLTADGRHVTSKGWHSLETVPPVLAAADDIQGLLVTPQKARLIDTATPPSAPPTPAAPASTPGTPGTPAATPALWDETCELVVQLELSRFGGRSSRPYVAVWIEDGEKYPVRTLALWSNGGRWLEDLKGWYRSDQLRILAETTELTPSVSSATRPAGKYTLKWDGKDNSGKLVKSGKYTICLEAAREHGTYQIMRQELDCNGTAAKIDLKGNVEIASAALDYHHKANAH